MLTGSYLLVLLITFMIVIVAHPSVHVNVGNRANQVFRECKVTNVIFIIK